MGQNEELRKLAETGLDLDALAPPVTITYQEKEYPIKYLSAAEGMLLQRASKKLARMVVKREDVAKQIESLPGDDDEQFGELQEKAEEWDEKITAAFNEFTNISIPSMEEGTLSEMPMVQKTAMSEFLLKVIGSASTVPPQPENS